MTPVRGRGSQANPVGRFETVRLDADDEAFDFYEPHEEEFSYSPKTQVFVDDAKTILSRNSSPDIPFALSINPYRGCEHGCSYCYARPNHEYLGLSAGLDFETKIFAKVKAAALLRDELGRKSYVPEPIAISGVTDAYQPIERKLKITRGCLEVLSECRNPVSLITKNHLVTRDLDLFRTLAADRAVLIFLSLTTLDANLGRVLEPRASSPAARLRAIETLSAAGIPVGVSLAPIIPGLNDHEIPNLLKAGRKAGARFAGMVPLRLPYGVSEIFGKWLEEHFPERKEKILGRVRMVRGGKLNDANFVSRMKGAGPYAEQMRNLFRLWRRKLGYDLHFPTLSADAFVRPQRVGTQMDLFA